MGGKPFHLFSIRSPQSAILRNPLSRPQLREDGPAQRQKIPARNFFPLTRRPINGFLQTVKIILGPSGLAESPSGADPVVGDQGAKLARGRFNEYFRRISAGGRLAAAGDTFGRASPLPPRKLYRVSEIADHLGVTRQTIHNYATIGLITEEDRTPGGQRLFDESVFMRLLFIQRMKHTHRLTEIRHVLEGRTPLPEIDIQPREPSEHIAAAPLTPAARGMLERMQELASIAHRDEPQTDAAPLAVPENAQGEGHTSTQQRVAMPPAPSASSHDSGLLPHPQRTTDEKATEPDAKHPV